MSSEYFVAFNQFGSFESTFNRGFEFSLDQNK